MDHIRFGIIGSGWRTDYFLRIAAALPDRFTATGALVRREEAGLRLRERFGVRAYETLDDLLAGERPDFVIVCVSWQACPGYIKELVARGVPVLSETPPAPDEDALQDLYAYCRARGGRVQVAEQYHLQPYHAARLALVHSGRLGDIVHAQVSVAHGYHGVSLIRRVLGIRGETVAIRAQSFTTPIVTGPDRSGPPSVEAITDSRQTVATLDFGDRWAVFDFCDDQYFSWIRSHRLLVRGVRGEVRDLAVSYLRDHRTPVFYDLVRVATGIGGDLEGFHLKGICGGDTWWYENPYPGARLSDDEIAGAHCLAKMGAYARGGPDFYSLAEAAQDHYLSILIGQAARSGETVRSRPQPWNEDV